MKKIVAVLVLALVVSTASVFALGIGAQGGASAGAFGGALTIKPDGSDLIFAINANLGDVTFIGITADKWVANKTLAKPVNYFYGLGVAGNASVGGNNLAVGVYGRALAGLNLFLLDNFFEIYLQGAWQPGVRVTLGNDTEITPVITNFPVDVGLRFWL